MKAAPEIGNGEVCTLGWRKRGGNCNTLQGKAASLSNPPHKHASGDWKLIGINIALQLMHNSHVIL
jgi:hypothetical protein